MLVAATLADETGEIFLVGATGLNYGNTAELNVMNYKQAMATVDKDEWNKAIKVEHDKMVKYRWGPDARWSKLLSTNFPVLKPTCTPIGKKRKFTKKAIIIVTYQRTKRKILLLQ